MAETLEIKVEAQTGEAVSQLKKAEEAVSAITDEAKDLDKAAEESARSLSDLGAKSAAFRKEAYEAGNAARSAAGAVAKTAAEAKTAGTALSGLKDQSTGVAKGMMAASGAVGPFGEILEKLQVSSTGATGKIAGLAFKAVAVAGAFKVGWDAGTKFNKFLQEHGNYLEKAIDATVRFTSARKDAESTGLAADIDLESEAITEHTKALAGQIVARKAARNATEEADRGIKESIAGWQSAADQQRKFTEEIGKVEAKFKDLTKTGADWRKEVEANRAPLEAWVKRLEDAKVPLDSLPESVRAMVEYLKSLGAAAAESVAGITSLAAALESLGKGDTLASIEAVASALEKIKAEGGDVGAAVAANAAGFQALRDAAEKNSESLQKFRTEIMDQIPAYQATEMAMKQYAGTLEGIAASVAEYEAARRAANEADIEAGVRMAEFKAHAAEMARSIDTIGEAWVKATGQAAGFTVEVRRATQAAKESSPEFDALVESLAVVSDEYERMIPWVGALIAQLESGAIGTEEFRRQMEALQVGFMQIQGVSGQMFGDLDTLWAKLTKILNEFTRKGK